MTGTKESKNNDRRRDLLKTLSKNLAKKLRRVGSALFAALGVLRAGYIVVLGPEANANANANGSDLLLLADGYRKKLKTSELPCQTSVYFCRRGIYQVIVVDEKSGKIVGRGELNLIDGGRDETVIEIAGKV